MLSAPAPPLPSQPQGQFARWSVFWSRDNSVGADADTVLLLVVAGVELSNKFVCTTGCEVRGLDADGGGRMAVARRASTAAEDAGNADSDEAFVAGPPSLA